MTTEELTMLLTRIQVLDNRQVDRLTLEAWEPLVAELDYDDAVAAVNNHFQTETTYLLPAHVVQGAAQARKQRIALARATPHQFVASGSRYPDICAVCHGDADRHTAGRVGCAHKFDTTSGYCLHCGIRDDDETLINPPIPLRGAA